MRQRLPNRRLSETFALQSDGITYAASISRFDDGRVGEVFLTTNKHGSAADTAARDAAIAASIALQYGADIETIRKALCRDGKGNPNGAPRCSPRSDRVERLMTQDQELLEAWRAIANAKLVEYRKQCWRLAGLVRQGTMDEHAAVDRLWEIARAHALVRSMGADRVQAIITDAFCDAKFRPIYSEVA